jgi:hypothetical protein
MLKEDFKHIKNLKDKIIISKRNSGIVTIVLKTKEVFIAIMDNYCFLDGWKVVINKSPSIKNQWKVEISLKDFLYGDNMLNYASVRMDFSLIGATFDKRYNDL